MENSFYAFEVKSATEEDIPAIHKITHDAFLKYCEMAGLDYNIEALTETYDDIRHDIETKNVFVVRIDDEPVGAVRIELLPDNEAYLSRFAVASSNRNNGIGKILMKVVDKVMKENNVKILKLHTCSKVTALIRFYYGRGFYISDVEYSRGYARAELVKEYK
ncbi:MAG: GNAT family N-acetyltransferase [Clostridiales bacterium]|nr:GNAT family N-acetyltransferase [Clostridiales bacterium]MBD9010407.1 GNAT family N-acetyltransferase [Clostridiales bacterium]